MNPSAKASYDKINQYRQKIKQTLISEQAALATQPFKQDRREQKNTRDDKLTRGEEKKDLNDYPKITSSLSRSNIRKNPNQPSALTSRILQGQPTRAQDQLRIYGPSRIVQGSALLGERSRVQQRGRIQDTRSRIQDNRSRVQDKTRLLQNKSRIQDKSRAYDNTNRLTTSELSRLEIPPKASEYLKSQIRTAQKPTTSKSPSAKTNPYLQEPQTMTKRKNSVKEIQKSTPKPGNPPAYDKTPSFNNLSAFDTFSPRIPVMPVSSSSLPPLFGRLNPSSQTSEHQVKVLVEQNQILSLHLQQKMEKIRTLERELKAVVKSQILHQEKYDIELSQLKGEKSMIKKSSEEQVKTLVMEVKKLNDELVEKEQQWQERVNMIRKTNLQQQQENKKHQMKMEEKYKAQLEQVKIRYQTLNEQFQLYKENAASTIQALKTDLTSINQSAQRLTHIHKMQKSSLSLDHDQNIKTVKEQLYTKLELLNLDKMRKQTQLNSVIDSLTKELKKVNNQLEDMKHQKEFTQVKDMQLKGKMMIQIREEKEKIQKIKTQENTKLQKISQAQLKAIQEAYHHQIHQLNNNIAQLQHLLQARAAQISNLYKEIAQMRKTHKQQVTAKDEHITNLHRKLQQLNREFLQEQQCFKIKLAQMMQANQQTLKDLYENKISQQQHLIIDKQQIISKLRQKIASQSIHASQVNTLHQKQLNEYLIRIQQLEQKLTSNALKQKNTNSAMDKENLVLKENLIRQSESYEKVALVKEESIKRLQKIIQTKDNQINQLEAKIELMKKAHKEQIHLINEQHLLLIREKEDILQETKEQLEYAKREQSKRSEQFMSDKQYFSNQLRELKNCKQTQFNSWVERMSGEINQLKSQNLDLNRKLSKVIGEYEEYKKLWNQEQSLNKLLAKQKQFMDKMNQAFTIKTQQIIQFYQKDIDHHYKPKIANLNDLIVQKDQQILDMKTNYHQLQMKFQKLIQEKQIFTQLSEKVLTLGKAHHGLASNYVLPSK